MFKSSKKGSGLLPTIGQHPYLIAPKQSPNFIHKKAISQQASSSPLRNRIDQSPLKMAPVISEMHIKDEQY